MYPWFRFLKTILKNRKAPKLGLYDTHVSQHICWPWDVDPWMELNNGRTLTLYDLGRVGLALRAGLNKLVMQYGWGLAVAGGSVRYRRRLRAFAKFEMRSRLIGWDERFLYLEQSMWRKGECHSHVLLRGAMTKGSRGIVPPSEVVAALGGSVELRPLPDWVSAWIAAEAQRPWPPMNESA